MKIGYWLGNTSLESGGVATYAWRVLETLLMSSKLEKIEILILCSCEAQEQIINLIDKYEANARLVFIPSRFNIISRYVSRFGDLISRLCVRYNIPHLGLKQLNYWFRWFSSLDINLLHVPYQTAPYYDLPYPLLVTMHDVQELHYPEFFTPQERAWRAEHYLKALEKCSGAIVSINHVKQDLIKYFRLDINKIYVCPLTYKTINLQKPLDEEKISYQNKYKQWHNFLLYPAQTWQHKNHIALIKAVEYLQDKFGIVLHVICTGRRNPGFFPVIEDYLKQSSVTDRIHFMDIVPETELYWLYKNCSLVVIPTLYEGGGFPLLEAMTLGVPVICSSVTSLPETIEDVRFIFNPLDIEAMAHLILQMLENDELRNGNILNSKNRIRELQKINSAVAFLNAYRLVLND